MLRLLSSISLLALGLAPTAAGAIDSGPIYMDPCAEVLAERLTTWVNSIESGKARYSTRREFFMDEIKEKVALRKYESIFRGNDFYIRRRSIDEKTGAVTGDWTRQEVKDERGYRMCGTNKDTQAYQCQTVVGMQRDGVRSMEQFSTLRDSINRTAYNDFLVDLMHCGRNFALNDHGLDVLSHWSRHNDSEDVDIYFDALGRVSRIVLIDRFGFAGPEEFCAEIGCAMDKALNAGRVLAESIFSNYHEINGVEFPCKITQTYFQSPPAIAQWAKWLETKKITWLEFVKGVIPLYENPQPRSTEVVTFDPNAIELNVAVEDGEMAVRAEPNDHVFNEKEEHLRREQQRMRQGDPRPEPGFFERIGNFFGDLTL